MLPLLFFFHPTPTPTPTPTLSLPLKGREVVLFLHLKAETRILLPFKGEVRKGMGLIGNTSPADRPSDFSDRPLFASQGGLDRFFPDEGESLPFQVEEGLRGLEFIASRSLQRDIDLSLDPSGSGGHNEDSIRKEDGLFHVVGDKQNGLRYQNNFGGFYARLEFLTGFNSQKYSKLLSQPLKKINSSTGSPFCLLTSPSPWGGLATITKVGSRQVRHRKGEGRGAIFDRWLPLES